MGVKVSVHTDSAEDCLLLQDERLLQLIFAVCSRSIFIHFNDMNSSDFIITARWLQLIFVHHRSTRWCCWCNVYEKILFLPLLQTNSSLRCEVFSWMVQTSLGTFLRLNKNWWMEFQDKNLKNLLSQPRFGESLTMHFWTKPPPQKTKKLLWIFCRH